MFNHTRCPKFRRLTVTILTPLLLGAVLVAAAPSATVTAQEQPANTSPAFDPAQVTAPMGLPLAAAGRASYLENCAPCHGETGLADGPTAADLPGPATAFADPGALQALSPAMLFHTTKFGRLEKLMPPWANQLTDDEIWNTVAYAWSLHTSAAESEAGATLYAASCAACHGDAGAGDGPQAEGSINDFTDLTYTTFASQADWLTGWQNAHPDIGANWSETERASTLEYIRTFSYIPSWSAAYRPGAGVLTGTVTFGADASQVDGGNVFLDAYLGFEPVAGFTTTLSVDNTFVFTNLATSPDLTYIATVLAAGVSYSSDMVSLTPEAPAAEVSIDVYGATDSPDAIRFNRVHWILESQPGALVVAQIYLVGNTGARTFIGQTVEGVDVPVTAGIQLPPEAVEVTFENGALGNRFQQVGDMVYDTMPIVPGESTQQIIVQYAIPYEGTRFDLEQAFAYPVDSLSLLIANYPNLRVDAPELTFDSIQNIQGAEYQIWGKEAFDPSAVELKLQGLLDAGAADPRIVSGATDGAGQLAGVDPPMETWVTWAMLGIVAAILLGLVGVALQRGALTTVSTRQELQAQREQLLRAIARLDDRHVLGELSDSEWLRNRATLKAQLMDVMRRLESVAQAA